MDIQEAIRHKHNNPFAKPGDPCPDCDGTGEVAGNYSSEDGMTTCESCGGKGTI